MSANDAAFTIVHRLGQKSETVATGLTRSAAREWLQRKAKGIDGAELSELILQMDESDESWAAVESE